VKRRLLTLIMLPALSAAAPFDPFGVATIDERPGVSVPLETRFRDPSGHDVALREIAAGRPFLLVPVLHDCPNFCGVTLDGLLAARERAGPATRQAPVIAFGIDPQETEAATRRSLEKLAARHPAAMGRVFAVTGTAAAIGRVTSALGYRYAYDPRIGQYAHVAATAVLTPDGRLVRWVYGIAPQPTLLRASLADAAAGRTGGVIDRLILLCYHYDPVEGRYGFAIDRLLKLGCLLTAAALGAFIIASRRRELRA